MPNLLPNYGRRTLMLHWKFSLDRLLDPRPQWGALNGRYKSAWGTPSRTSGYIWNGSLHFLLPSIFFPHFPQMLIFWIFFFLYNNHGILNPFHTVLEIQRGQGPLKIPLSIPSTHILHKVKDHFFENFKNMCTFIWTFR
jgi:hypothetical protein